MKKVPLVLLAFFMPVLFAGCGNQTTGTATSLAGTDAVTTESFAMDTILTQTAYGDAEDVLQQNNRLVAEIEQKMSKTIETSEVYLINHAGGQPVEASAETLFVLGEALAAADETSGAFNPALGNIMAAWGFRSAEPSVPPADQIAQLLSSTDYRNIQVVGSTVNAGNTSIDLGGAVKGYALDMVAENLAAQGVDSALINFGGSIYAVGQKPDDTPFVIGIKHPDFGQDADSYMGTLSVDGLFISTSGTYERGFEEDGVWYHHLIDPQTGYPVQNELQSVTIISESGLTSDFYSTALFVMGEQAGLEFARQNGIDALFLTEDGQAVTTDGFAEKYDFKITSTDYHEA